MNFTFTKEQEKFRKEVREFLRGELLDKGYKARCGGLIENGDPEFSKKMSAKGYIGMTWPKKYGGQGRTYVEKAILMEEMMRVQAPLKHHFGADRQIGPAIIAFGSEWQKEHFLPRFTRCEEGIRFCLLFSEPNAGSDLMNVQTTATKDGDDYIIRGQKVWSSGGHLADYGWLLAVTNPDTSIAKHLRCSEFILDMKLPGITVRPIINIAGAHSFNEVFFDDVRVSSKFRVGEDGAGFKQIMAQMDYERAGFERLMQNFPILEQAKEMVKKMATDGTEREFYFWAKDQVAQLEIEFNIGRLLCYYTAWTIDQGRQPTGEAATAKAYCTQFEQRLNDVASRILGPTSIIRGEDNPWAALEGEMATCLLWQPSYTLQGGSVEILKNIIATRKLKMPRK